MLNLVPLTGSWRIMTNRYVQPRLIRPMLQFHLPHPKAVAITATAISTNQHIHLNRLPFRLPFLPGFLVVSDQFLLLGVDRDDRPASAQERLALALDVAKLSIPIGMLLPFFGFGITLQTVV